MVAVRKHPSHKWLGYSQRYVGDDVRSLKLKTRNPQSPIRNLNETRHLVSYKNNGAGCMVADRKVWPDARTGAKGQRPAHGRAGAGLASPAGTGVGAAALIMAL